MHWEWIIFPLKCDRPTFGHLKKYWFWVFMKSLTARTLKISKERHNGSTGAYWEIERLIFNRGNTRIRCLIWSIAWSIGNLSTSAQERSADEKSEQNCSFVKIHDGVKTRLLWYRKIHFYQTILHPPLFPLHSYHHFQYSYYDYQTSAPLLPRCSRASYFSGNTRIPFWKTSPNVCR